MSVIDKIIWVIIMDERRYYADHLAIGQRIKEHRMLRNLTQQELAELISVQTSQISLIETGRSHISVERLCEIAWNLNVSPNQLIVDSNTTGSEYLTAETTELLYQIPNTHRQFVFDWLSTYIKHLNSLNEE